MSLTLRKRHTADCRKKNGIGEYQHFLRCACPFWAVGTLREDGYVRVSTKESKLDLAELAKRQWEERGTVAVIAKKEPAPDEGAVRLADAITSFRGGYILAKKLKQGTVHKYDTFFRFLEQFAADKGLRYVKELNLAELQAFQATWNLGALSAAKRLTLVKAFLSFCLDSEYIASSPARKLRAPAAPITQKEPFSDAEMERILAAAKDYPAHADKETLGQKSYALVMVMRHSGLRISDTLLLSPDKLDGNKLFLYMKKTGEPVSVWVPNVVVGALKALPPARNGRYFWSRSTNELESVRKAWGDVFKNIFRRAGPFSSKPHAHRFRHTFAAGLLQRGVPLDDVAVLLGHANSKVTAAHYARWIRARQDRLDAIVQEAWGDPELKDKEFRLIPGGKPAAKPAKTRHAATTKQRR